MVDVSCCFPFRDILDMQHLHTHIYMHTLNIELVIERKMYHQNKLVLNIAA